MSRKKPLASKNPEEPEKPEEPEEEEKEECVECGKDIEGKARTCGVCDTTICEKCARECQERRCNNLFHASCECYCEKGCGEEENYCKDHEQKCGECGERVCPNCWNADLDICGGCVRECGCCGAGELSPEDVSYCETCEHDVCNDCYTSCDGGDVHREQHGCKCCISLENCSVCGSASCDECIKELECGDKAHIGECSFFCDKCERDVCTDCVEVVDDEDHTHVCNDCYAEYHTEPCPKCDERSKKALCVLCYSDDDQDVGCNKCTLSRSCSHTACAEHAKTCADCGSTKCTDCSVHVTPETVGFNREAWLCNRCYSEHAPCSVCGGESGKKTNVSCPGCHTKVCEDHIIECTRCPSWRRQMWCWGCMKRVMLPYSERKIYSETGEIIQTIPTGGEEIVCPECIQTYEDWKHGKEPKEGGSGFYQRVLRAEKLSMEIYLDELSRQQRLADEAERARLKSERAAEYAVAEEEARAIADQLGIDYDAAIRTRSLELGDPLTKEEQRAVERAIEERAAEERVKERVKERVLEIAEPEPGIVESEKWTCPGCGEAVGNLEEDWVGWTKCGGVFYKWHRRCARSANPSDYPGHVVLVKETTGDQPPPTGPIGALELEEDPAVVAERSLPSDAPLDKCPKCGRMNDPASESASWFYCDACEVIHGWCADCAAEMHPTVSGYVPLRRHIAKWNEWNELYTTISDRIGEKITELNEALKEGADDLVKRAIANGIRARYQLLDDLMGPWAIEAVNRKVEELHGIEEMSKRFEKLELNPRRKKPRTTDEKLQLYGERGWCPVRWSHHPREIKDVIRQIKLVPQIKDCWANTQRFMLRGALHLPDIKYWEGWVCRKDIPIPFAHAWLVWRGEIVDLTIDDNDDVIYDPVRSYSVSIVDVFAALARNRIFGPVNPERLKDVSLWGDLLRQQGGIYGP